MTNHREVYIIANVASEKRKRHEILENDTERNKKNKQSDSKMSESPFSSVAA